MIVETLYKLRDGTRHKTLDKALNHCDEQMGAELRNIVDQLNPSNNYLHRTMLKIVSDKAYDKELFEYVAWRKEHDDIEAYIKHENNEFNPDFDFDNSNDGEALDEIYKILNSNELPENKKYEAIKDFMEQLKIL